MPSNDLIDFMKSATLDIENEYNRIQKRVLEDAGTAGDQGEENWATLLRNWLPPTFQIVTKGRILSHDGFAGPQIDILVLSPEYPKHLLDKKVYLAGGVVAAFECKITLKTKHIEEFFQNSVEIKSHLPKRIGSPYKDLYSPIMYGLLAHSNYWKGEDSLKIENCKEYINRNDELFITHPRLAPDIICIADLCSFDISKMCIPDHELLPVVQTSYICHAKGERQSNSYTSIGAMITYLLRRLAWEYPNLRSLSGYFDAVNLQGNGNGYARVWNRDGIYSSETIEKRRTGHIFSNGKRWDEWSVAFY